MSAECVLCISLAKLFRNLQHYFSGGEGGRKLLKQLAHCCFSLYCVVKNAVYILQMFPVSTTLAVLSADQVQPKILHG